MRTPQGRTGHLLRQDRSGEHACFIYGTIAEAGSTRTSVPVVLIDGFQNPGGGSKLHSDRGESSTPEGPYSEFCNRTSHHNRKDRRRGAESRDRPGWCSPHRTQSSVVYPGSPL